MKSTNSTCRIPSVFKTGRGVGAFAMIALLNCTQPFVICAVAGPREDAAAAMTRCDRLVDNKAWLDCLDAASAQMRAAIRALGAAAAQPQFPANRSSGGEGRILGHPEAAPPQQFGQEDLRSAHQNARGGAKRLTARVTNFSFSPTGYFTVELDNGQVWRQVNGDTDYARFRTPARLNLVNIERGFLGSYNLHIQGRSDGYKVRRVQ